MTIRVAVIGAGIMGRDHARIVAGDLPGACLQVVCDAAPDRACSVASEVGAKDATTDPEATISRKDVDAILIASPDATHAPLVIAALAVGKPVLCEKPLAQDPAGCRKVIEVEMATGHRLVQVGFMRRFDPAYGEMKRVLDTGQIGRALMLHNIHRAVMAPADFTGPMAITNSAPHEFDIARFILGGEIQAVTAFSPRPPEAAADCAPVFLAMETTGGQVVSVEVHVNAGYGYDVRSALVGETGTAVLAPPVHGRLNSRLASSELYPVDWRPRFAEAYRLQAKAWLRSIELGQPDLIAASAWDGYCAAMIAEAGTKSLMHGQRAKIDYLEAPSLYRHQAAY